MQHCKRDCPFKDEFDSTIDELEHISYSIELLSRINRIILETSNENKLIHSVCDSIVNSGLYKFAAVFYFQENLDELFIAASSDYTASDNFLITLFTTYKDFIESVRNNDIILITNNAEYKNDSIKIISDKSADSDNLCLPLKDRLNQSIGLLLIKSDENKNFLSEEIKVLEDLAQDLSIAISRIRLKEEQKLIKINLESAETKYKLLAENSSDIISILDSQGKILYASPSLKTILGYSTNEIENLSAYDLIHPNDLNKVRKIFQYTIDKKAEGKVRYRAKTKIGNYIWVESSGKAIINDGSILLQTTTREISDRMEFENKLFESAARLKLALMATNTGLWDWDLKKNEVYYSKNYLELLGYSITDKIDVKHFWRLVTHPDDLQKVDSVIQNHLANKASGFEIEYRKIKKNGEIIWILDKGAVVECDELGIPIRMTGTITDITKRKEAEEKLRESEEKYRLIVENSHDGIEISQDDRFIYWNKQFAQMLGYTFDEIKNITFKDIYTPEGLRDLLERQHKRANGEFIPKSYTTTYRKKDGSKIDVQINYEIIEYNGKPATLGTIKDITEQKKVERLTKSSEEFLQKSLDSLSSNIAVLDETGNIIAVNKRWKEFGEQNGLKEKDFCVGTNYIKVCETSEGEDKNYAHLVAREIKSMLKGEKTEFHFEYPCHSPQEKRWFIAHFTSFEHNGKPRVIVAHENITERKIAEQKILEAKEKAEEANKLKSNFLLNMSHELRTPLVGILGFAEILSSEIENDEHKKMVETIYESGKRLLETLSLILNLSKIESGREEVNISEFDVNAICNEVANLFAASAKKKNLIIKQNFRFTELIVESDPRLIRDVLNNLVNNAIKFTHEGSITISTFITNYKEKNYIAIEVADTGIGIPEDKIDLIFEEFRQVSEGMNRSFEGTGLGLSLTKKVVSLLGGEITVESKLGVGTKFTVYLPSEYKLHQVSFENKASTDTVEPELISKGLNEKKILVVEDDWVSRKFVEIVLRDICKIDFAVSSVEALEKIKNTIYDAILMDINLGRGLDGIVTTKLIRDIPQYKSTPIAAITAFATPQDKAEFLEKGCSHYLSKPYGKSDLINLLKEMLKTE